MILLQIQTTFRDIDLKKPVTLTRPQGLQNSDGDFRSLDDHIQHHHDDHRYHHLDYNVVPPVTAAQSPRAVLKSVDSNCLRHDIDDDDHFHHTDNHHHPTDFMS